jgi:hypothetical protein
MEMDRNGADCAWQSAVVALCADALAKKVDKFKFP